MTLIEKIKVLDVLEKKAKPAKWYAWTRPSREAHVEDSCIMTLPEDEYVKEKKLFEQYDEYRYASMEEEVIGCSEWMRAEPDDLIFCAESRNMTPDMLDVLKQFKHGDADLLERLHNELLNVFHDPSWDSTMNCLYRLVIAARMMEREEERA